MEAQIHERFSFGPFVLDPGEKVLLRDGRPLPLPPKAIETLLALIERNGHVVEKAELLRRVWPDTFVEEATLAQNIFTLRKALNGASDALQYIETVPKRGYRFSAPVEVLGTPQLPPVSAAPAQPLRLSPALLWSLSAAVLVAALLIGVYLHGRSHNLAAKVPGQVTLAVLPFENFTGDPAQDYLSEGLTEEMIAQLSRIDPERLRVIARTTAMQYKGTSKTVAQIGRELGVDYILESSFRREGDRARITTQLVRSSDQTHVWSQNYERDAREILPLETEVAQAITREIERKFSVNAQPPAAGHAPIDPRAYQLYLQGRYFWNKRSEQGHLKAIEYFDRAIAVEPGYAQAYSGLADAYALLGSNPTTTITRRDAMSKARDAALRAISLDDTLAEAHTSLAYVYWHYDWNWAAAEKEFQRALQLNPSYATAHHWYSFYLVSQGRMEQALAEIRLAQQMDPLSLIINTDVAQTLFFARQYDPAIAQARHVLEMNPEFSLARLILVWCYLAQHQNGLAVEQAKQGIGVPGAEPSLTANLAVTYAVVGQTPQARELLRGLEAESKRRHNSLLCVALAQIYAALGDKDSAFRWLQTDLQYRDGGLTLIKVLPFFDSLHADRRFADLVHRIGL